MDRADDLSIGDRFSMPRHPIYTVIGLARYSDTVVVAVLPKKKGAEKGDHRILHLSVDRAVKTIDNVAIDRHVLAGVDLSGQIPKYVPRERPTARTCRRCGNKLDRWGYCESFSCIYSDRLQ